MYRGRLVLTSTPEDLSNAQDMGELLDSMESMKPLRRGDVVEGLVMRADPDGILLNIGHKAEGIVPPGEMRTLGAEGLEKLQVGDEVVALVVRGETSEGAAVLSIDKAVGEIGWRTLDKARESGDQLEGRILGFNRGGAIVEVEGVQGFVPMSQLVSVSRDNIREARRAETAEARATEQPTTEQPTTEQPTTEQPTAEQPTTEQPTTEQPTTEQTAEGGEPAAGTKEPSEGSAAPGAQEATGSQEAPSAKENARPEPPDDIGKVLTLKVLEVNRGRNRAILSERQALQTLRDERKARLIEELSVGEVRRGKVTGISTFGAFVDLGGADGLVHISELSWGTVRSPEEVVSVGDEVDVYVLRIDAENRKIALSLKRLQPEPWETINERYQPGDIVDATVTKLTDFGAFARVEGSVEGLIHISELASRVINHPREVVGEGDNVRLKILRIEPERRRLGLSLRQAEEEEGY